MSNRPSQRTRRQQARNRARAAGGGGGAAPSARAQGRRFWIGGAVIAVIAVVLGVIIASGGDDGEQGALEVGFAETIGAPLAQYAGLPDPAVGTPAPTIRAQSMWTEEVVDIAMDQGGVKVIGFFAHWCPHCQRELPRVSSYFNANGAPEGVSVYAVSTSVDSGVGNYPPSSWFSREGWPYDVLVDNERSSVASGMGLSGFPYWVVVGPDGNVLERVSGEMSEADFADFVTRAAAAV